MSKKALSVDEKKTRLLQLFYEKKEFFQLKELEKIAPKEKGIVANSVKAIVQALVDDGSVDTDKIGGSIYFWAFPSKVVNVKKRKLEDVQNRLEMSTKKLKLVRKSIEDSENDNEHVKSGDQILTDIEQLQSEKEALRVKVEKCSANSSSKLDEVKKHTQSIKEAANRWTDNIFAVKSWCKKKFMIEDKVLNKQFGISEDLDYIE